MIDRQGLEGRGKEEKRRERREERGEGARKRGRRERAIFSSLLFSSALLSSSPSSLPFSTCTMPNLPATWNCRRGTKGELWVSSTGLCRRRRRRRRRRLPCRHRRRRPCRPAGLPPLLPPAAAVSAVARRLRLSSPDRRFAAPSAVRRMINRARSLVCSPFPPLSFLLRDSFR